MLRALILILAVLSSTSAYSDSIAEYDHKASRELTSISDLFPSLDTLDCTPKCGGAPVCGEFSEMNSCLDDGAPADCFWSCE